MLGKPWAVPPEWPGETAFIVAGGPSVRGQPLELLRGRRAIAVNTSWEAVPWAAFLFFGDSRWWREHRERTGIYAGRIVTVSRHAVGPGLLRLDKHRPPPALRAERTAVAQSRTSLAGAIGLAVHLGAARLVLLGADGGPAPDGRTHHHAPHPWPPRPDCWGPQLAELRALAPALAARRIAVRNASPGTRIDWWPVARLEDCLGNDWT